MLDLGCGVFGFSLLFFDVGPTSSSKQTAALIRFGVEAASGFVSGLPGISSSRWKPLGIFRLETGKLVFSPFLLRALVDFRR